MAELGYALPLEGSALTGLSVRLALRAPRKDTMTGREFASVNGAIDNEGFDYAFVNYSNFDDVKDEKFHELRQAFLNARQELKEYVGAEED
jgi:hypothetical protein